MRIGSIMAFALTVLLSTSGVQASSGDLNIYGFMSVGVGILDKDTVTIEGFEGEGNFKQDTIFALQVSKQVNDKTTATGQLVSRGTDDFKTEAAWAFVSYQATEELTARMGRLRIPFFYYSEFLEEGYAYNWVRLPSDIYNIPFSSFDGVDFTQRFSIGSLDNSIQVNYGRLTDDLNIFDEVKDFLTLGFNSNLVNYFQNFSFRRDYISFPLGEKPAVGTIGFAYQSLCIA